ncbi:unnamed protein product [Camellia sinensis]
MPITVTLLRLGGHTLVIILRLGGQQDIPLILLSFYYAHPTPFTAGNLSYVPIENESQKDANTGDHGSFQEAFLKQFQNLITPILVIGLFLTSFSFGPREQQQISFQEFKNKLLELGLVDHVVVSNKSVAKVYVRSSPRNQTSNDVVEGPIVQGPADPSKSQYKYYFNIGSVESFEEKLEEAQEALGIDSHDYVPVTYTSEMVWYQELV